MSSLANTAPGRCKMTCLAGSAPGWVSRLHFWLATGHTLEDISQFVLNRSAAHIKRYHTTPMYAQESVAEHSHFVAMITRTICYALEQASHPVDTLRAVDLAMIHDYEEAISGDIISTFKHSDAELVE